LLKSSMVELLAHLGVELARNRSGDTSWAWL
jgi:hypothetical protein